MTRRRVLALVVVAALSPRMRPWALDLLVGHVIERAAARSWLPSTRIGPARIGRYAVALAATSDTTNTIGATLMTTSAPRYADDDQPMIPIPRRPGKHRAKPRHWWTGRDATQTKKEVLCPGHQHHVGLVLVHGDDGRAHLGFRLHQIVTAGGWKIPCGVSLKFACQVEIPNRPDVVCPHVEDEHAAARSWATEGTR